GGDGGILREVLKHPHVESVVLCEIDKKVVDACKKYLPSMAASFGHPKVTLHIGDGLEFMKKNQNRFDVIITDSSDPIGPAETLFTDSYYHLLNGALTENGVLASQGSSVRKMIFIRLHIFYGDFYGLIYDQTKSSLTALEESRKWPFDPTH
uniref:PABS domain-containing protein n=1 Tax=Romanomermis culicivorax TaxID=13658 RepID=A0A915L879_ROMCU